MAIAAALIAAAATITGALITSRQVPLPWDSGDTESSETRRETVPESVSGGQKKSPGIAVTPKSLTFSCEGDSCAQEVRVLSTGTATLKIADIEFEGDNPGDFQHDNACAGQALDVDDECTLRVWFAPASTGSSGSASLVIHQNLKGDATYVNVSGEGTQQPTDEPTPESSEPAE
ncbi:choice-of-anchor D domain-containing protein [Nonomuraea endophytica]|uniref:choice-of-anchor D domain-containing protein n=1 Tax=Nonomuraea endophytica TaxID=714136 RepID=UPI0037C6373B